jgi:hypothetical protein
MSEHETHSCADSIKKRTVQSFEPIFPILEMNTLELKKRQQTNPRSSKTTLLEDCIATSLGGRYPRALKRFRQFRQLLAENDARQSP